MPPAHRRSAPRRSAPRRSANRRSANRRSAHRRSALGRPPLRKALGQHHLRDGGLCRPLVEYLRPRGARVVEIGPGGGVLTAELMRDGARVLALELDLAWALRLHAIPARSHDGERPAIAVADALDLAWERLPAGTLVAGNLPYNVATAIIERCLMVAAGVPRAAFLVQLEVAERLVAKPGDAAYGSLSVVVAAYAEATLLGRVRRGSFVPPPKVDGAFVGLERRPAPLPPAAMPALLATVRLAFGQRRKTLRNALASGWGRMAAEAALATARLDPGARAETLRLEDFLALHEAWTGTQGALAKR